MDYVAIDLGASGTRFTTVDKQVYFIPNNVFWSDDMSGMGGVIRNSEEIENNLDVSIFKSEGNVELPITKDDVKKRTIFPMRAIIGTMAERTGITVTPKSGINKVDQRINYLSVLTSVALSIFKNPSMSGEINLFSLLPPDEIKHYAKKWEDALKGHYTVVFNKTEGKVTVEFTIKTVYALEESRMAMMQFLFDPRYPERRKKYSSDYILSIDIGASTTDLAIFNGDYFLEKTATTIKSGCNIARDYIANEASSLINEQMTPEAATQALIEGRIKTGRTYADKDATKRIIDGAKRSVANTINSALDTYFSRIGIGINSISYIVVSGGGSMPSSYVEGGQVVETSLPMSDYIEEALHDRCPNVEVVSFGDEPRTANIRGVGMFASACGGVMPSD